MGAFDNGIKLRYNFKWIEFVYYKTETLKHHEGQWAAGCLLLKRFENGTHEVWYMTPTAAGLGRKREAGVHQNSKTSHKLLNAE